MVSVKPGRAMWISVCVLASLAAGPAEAEIPMDFRAPAASSQLASCQGNASSGLPGILPRLLPRLGEQGSSPLTLRLPTSVLSEPTSVLLDQTPVQVAQTPSDPATPEPGTLVPAGGGALSPTVSPAPASAPSPAKAQPPFPQGEAAFREVFNLLVKKHVDSHLSPDDLYQAAIEGMLERASLELQTTRPRKPEDRDHPSNALLSPQDRVDMSSYLRGQITGIGTRLEPNDVGGLDIIQVFHKSPAERAGLKPRDRVVRIDGRRLDELNPPAIGALFRGPPGSQIRLGILRDGQPIDITAVREVIEIEAATGELLPPDIGLLRIHYFSEEAPRQARGILLELKNRGVRGLVLDLRDNGGGSLEAALQFLDLFVPNKKTVVQLEDRAGRRERFFSKGNPILSVPIVVLVNYNTASSAEIVARALSENLRTRIVGEQTYGKATAEEILPLKNGFAVRLSNKRILGPQGASWEAAGLAPDIVVKCDSDVSRKANLASSVEERLRLDDGLHTAVQMLMK